MYKDWYKTSKKLFATKTIDTVKYINMYYFWKHGANKFYILSSKGYELGLKVDKF